MTLQDSSNEIERKMQEQIDAYRKEISTCKKSINETQNRVLDARAQGDLVENAEYHAALQDLKTLNRKFKTLSEKVETYDLYKSKYEFTGSVITQGSTVRMRNITNGETYIIKVVPEGMGMPAIGALAEDCAVCKEIMGARAGQRVKVLTTTSQYDYEIQEVI